MSNAKCPNCVGLPVEIAITKFALSKGYVVVAQSSKDRASRCWTSDDVPLATKTVARLREKMNIPADLPNVLIGASSGGSLVALLSLVLPNTAAACVHVSAMPSEHQHMLHSLPHPPALMFLHMSRDKRTSRDIERMVTNNEKNLSKNKPNIVDFLIYPKIIDNSYFFDHSEALSLSDSALVVGALKKYNIVSPVSGLLLGDPRRSTWRDVVSTALPHVVPSRDSLLADQSAVSELLNLAYAMHEVTDDYLKEVFAFFELAAVELRKGKQ